MQNQTESYQYQNMEELSTKALVTEVGKFRESVEKNTMVATKLEKSLVENNYMLAKLTEAINRFKTVAEENELRKEGEKREEEHGKQGGNISIEKWIQEMSAEIFDPFGPEKSGNWTIHTNGHLDFSFIAWQTAVLTHTLRNTTYV